MFGTEKRQRLTLISTLLVSFLVRSIGISSRPVWYDEAFAVLFAEKGPGAMLVGTLTSTGTGAADIHPLGYYSFLWVWMRAFGQSLVAARLLSILAGVATIYFVYLITKRLFDIRIASIAALFVALAPFHIHYSQEIRMYAFLAMWLTIATYAFLRGSKHDSWMWWALFSVASALAQYTHNLAAIYLIPLAIFPLFRRDKKTLMAVILASMGALLLYLPWLVQLPSQFSRVSNAYWVERPGIAKLFTLLLTYVTNLPVPEGWLFPALFIALAATSIAIVQTFRGIERNASGIWLFYLSFAPPLLLFLVSQWVPVYIERALLPSGVMFCIWLAWAFFSTSMPMIFRTVLVGLLAIGVVLGIWHHASYRGFPYAPYAEVSGTLRMKMATGDIIVHSNKLSMLPMLYHDRSLPQLYVTDPSGSSTDTLAKATREVLELKAAQNIYEATQNAHRIWFIIFERSIAEAQAAGMETHPQMNYLHQNFVHSETEQWGELQVHLFEKKP
jgi:mannosyltransferase